MTVVLRLWKFSVMDFDDHESYLDTDGREIDRSDAAVFIGTDEDAIAEADRRSFAWEDREDVCAAIVTYHSMGEVKT